MSKRRFSAKPWTLGSILALLLLPASVPAQQPKPFEGKEPFHPTRILAKFAASQKALAGTPSVLGQQGLQIQRQFRLLPQTVVLDLADANQAKAVGALAPAERARQLLARIAALRASGLFEYVEPDYVRRANLEPTDAAYTNGTLWALHNFGQSNGVPGADIGAAAAWDITTGSTNVIVAVVDTGIRYTHQDLAAQMWRDPAATNFICGTNAAAGNSDPMDDSVDQYGNPEGHGTHVAGTIGAAANNGAPHVGMAWNVQLMACKLFDASGSAASADAFVSQEIACLEYAWSKGARIINASYGGLIYSQAEYDAIRSLRDQGVLLVAAAGNNGWDNDAWLRSYPASLDLYNIISVAAMDRADNLANFSNYGRSMVHLGAPGVDIFSCINSSDSAYASYPGTSMATPHVTGAAALLLARYPNANLTELRRRILSGVVPIPSLANRTATGGRLNVYNSLAAAPKGSIEIEASPRPGQPIAGGRSVTLYAIVTDVLPVTNATVTASIADYTNLTLLDGGTAPDALAGDGVYSVSFFVPTNLPSLEVTLQVSASGWPETTNLVSYPVILPPPNDDFANRIPIPQSDCDVVVTGSTFNASREFGEPYHNGWPIGHSAWWSWIAPTNGPVKISTAGSGFDTMLSVYTGPTVSNLTLVTEDDDANWPYDVYSAVSFNAVARTQYQIAVDGYFGDQGPVVLHVFPLASALPLDEALDCPGLASTTGGDVGWLGETCVAQVGTNAARSGPIEAYGQSWMEATIAGPGVLTFWWKVSSQANGDYLRFYINGVEQSSISGEVDWRQEHYWLGVSNTLRWAYIKDRGSSAGQDAGWVDEVSFVHANSAIPTAMGDLDGDGQPTVLDMTLLVGYFRDTNSLRPQVAVFADVNRDGVINGNDIPALADAILGRTTLLPALDADGDGIPDVLEPLMGLDPTKKDSFGDGIADGDRDFDMDGLSNARELALGTDPLRADTDGDGWSDEAELSAGSNPLDTSSRPYMMVVSAPQVAVVLPANQGAGGLTNNTVVASPAVALVLPADQGAQGLALNTTVAHPPVALVLPWDVGPDGLTNNTVLAMPPVALVLPADQGAQGLALNTAVALPPVALVLPWDLGPNGLTNNTVLAMPPVALVLPADQGPAGLTNNTVIAQPPVTIELDAP